MCQTYGDHCWREPRFVESGRDARGDYQRFIVRCAECPREMFETRRVGRPAPVSAQEPTEEGGQS